LKALAVFERHESRSKKASSTASKIFFTQLLNTAIITLIVNAAYTGSGPLSFLTNFGLLSGSYEDYSRDWYSAIGATMSTTMLVNILVPHASLIVNFLKRPIDLFLLAPSSVTQDQMNDYYEGAEFDIETRYAIMLNTLFVTLIFAGGIPLLIPLACLNYFLTFLVDKFFLLTYYTKPPNYDASLAKMFSGMMPAALLINLGFTCWFLSSEVYNQSGEKEYLLPSMELETNRLFDENAGFIGYTLSRVSLYSVFPTFFLLVVFIVLSIIYIFLGKRLITYLQVISSYCSAMCSSASTKSFADDILDNEQELGFTAVYEKEMTDVQLKYYMRTKKLKKIFADQGFVVQPDEVNLRKIWMDDGMRDGKWHYKGTEKRVWEFVADSTLYSYDILLNKKYKLAVKQIRKVASLSPMAQSNKGTLTENQVSEVIDSEEYQHQEHYDFQEGQEQDNAEYSEEQYQEQEQYNAEYSEEQYQEQGGEGDNEEQQ